MLNSIILFSFVALILFLFSRGRKVEGPSRFHPNDTLLADNISRSDPHLAVNAVMARGCHTK